MGKMMKMKVKRMEAMKIERKMMVKMMKMKWRKKVIMKVMKMERELK
jgi:hypothetical protein